MLHRLRYLLLVVPLLYLATLARSPVLGDPTEYTIVAHTVGIAHPPGYAFITLMGKVFQTLIPLGSIAWRTHLLAASAATLSAFVLFAMVRTAALSQHLLPNQPNTGQTIAVLSALFAALTVATGANQWQHAIHTNPHIITAAFLALNLYLLTHWWRHGADGNGALLAFCFSAGLGLTHHPLTVFAFPAYALFILATRPRLLGEWRTLLKMAAVGLLGLSIWLYFPLRSPMEPAFGPDNMNTLDGFLNVVLARGLRVNLFHFGLEDQLDRALVFWTALRLQYGLPTVSLALVGLIWLGRRSPRLLLLYGLAFLGNTIFVINSVQDVMAYLLGPFLLVGLFAGFGLLALLWLVVRRLPSGEPSLAPPVLLAVVLFLLGPLLQTIRNAPRVTLAHYSEGSDHIDAVFNQFTGTRANAVLLHDWEHMTPMWYAQFVQHRWPDPADVQPILVSSDRTWVDLVFDFLPGGPLYVTQYTPEIVAAGFRLRPEGAFYRVVETQTDLPGTMRPLAASQPEEAAIIGYQLSQRPAAAGDLIPLTLALRSQSGTEDYYVPLLHVGDIAFLFTTDNHVVSPLWNPGEVIVERFDITLPHNIASGEFPLRAQIFNLSQNRAEGPVHDLGNLTVTSAHVTVRSNDLLANFRQRVGLVGASASAPGYRSAAPWQEPLVVAPGESIHLTLTWRSLAPAEHSYTIFVHLIDGANRPVAGIDYTPLGGAMPTHLWISKWLPGQQMLDPYRLRLPAHLPAGEYAIEVGLYEMARGTVSGRRLLSHDADGNVIGDRTILGPVQVR